MPLKMMTWLNINFKWEHFCFWKGENVSPCLCSHKTIYRGWVDAVPCRQDRSAKYPPHQGSCFCSWSGPQSIGVCDQHRAGFSGISVRTPFSLSPTQGSDHRTLPLCNPISEHSAGCCLPIVLEMFSGSRLPSKLVMVLSLCFSLLELW